MAEASALSEQQLRTLDRLMHLPGSEGESSELAIAALLGVATTKLVALTRRGNRRDFWDLYALLTQSPMTLDEALDAYVRRFGPRNNNAKGSPIAATRVNNTNAFR